MSITLDKSLGAIAGSPDWIAIQVQDASDPEAAALALELAIGDICGLAGPKFISPVSRAATGPLFFMDAVDSPRRALARIPEAIVLRLEEVGIAAATVVCPPTGGPLSQMFGPGGRGVPRAATLVLYPPPPSTYAEWRGRQPHLPDAWMAEAAAWLAGSPDGDDDLYAAIVNVEFPIRPADAEATLRQAADAGNSLTLVSGALGRRIRQVALPPEQMPRLLLSGGGPATSDDELLSLAEDLIRVARRVAGEVAYAVMSIDPILSSHAIGDWEMNHGGEQARTVEALCDEHVVDAFPYQVLGPGHIARLDEAPPSGEPLANGRVGLPVGKVADWLLTPLDRQHESYPQSFNLCQRRSGPAVVEYGRRVLAPCLLRDGEGRPLLSDRRQP